MYTTTCVCARAYVCVRVHWSICLNVLARMCGFSCAHARWRLCSEARNRHDDDDVYYPRGRRTGIVEIGITFSQFYLHSHILMLEGFAITMMCGHCLPRFILPLNLRRCRNCLQSPLLGCTGNQSPLRHPPLHADSCLSFLCLCVCFNKVHSAMYCVHNSRCPWQENG